MRRFMITVGSTVVVLGSSLIASGQDVGPPPVPGGGKGPAPMQAPMQAPKQAPLQAPMQAAKQAPMQAPMQAPKQAPMQAPQQKIAPVQAPMQAPPKSAMQAPYQSPVQKGGAAVPGPMASDEVVPQVQTVAMGRPGLFRRFR